MISALRAVEKEGHSHNPFEFGARFRFDAATVTVIKNSPGTPKRTVEPPLSVQLIDLWQRFRIMVDSA
jgi:hypothetical protein